MPSKTLLAAEIVQTAVSVLCLIRVLLTLRDAQAIRRRVIAGNENHGNEVWSRINLRNKWCLVAVGVFCIGIGIDRIYQLGNGYHPPDLGDYVFISVSRTAISILTATTAWSSMKAYHRLREGVGPATRQPPDEV